MNGDMNKGFCFCFVYANLGHEQTLLTNSNEVRTVASAEKLLVSYVIKPLMKSKGVLLGFSLKLKYLNNMSL